jgi:glyoxylase-like metal-dependent hydrolase (beta-lactamase superfamily II)
MTMKMHAIQTGTVSIKTRQDEGVGRGQRRQLNMLLDREWTEPLPMYAFAIEHPEGVIVVDTGETARVLEPGYTPRWHPFYRFGLKEWIAPQDEIGPQLERLGIAPADVRSVVLTHMHVDHAGGLYHFPNNEILVSRTEYELASGFRGRVRGYLSNHFPTWLNPTLLDLPATPYGPFPRSLKLTDAGDVTLVGLEGHTPGHIGVVVEEDDHLVLFAGDSSYNQDLMLRGAVDGVSPDEAAARSTHERIRALAAERPTVYLVAHDPQTGERLAERRPVQLRSSDALAR